MIVLKDCDSLSSYEYVICFSSSWHQIIPDPCRGLQNGKYKSKNQQEQGNLLY